jgi:hypothetical protein
MKSTFAWIGLLLIVYTLPVWSQGFDWEYSARMPFEIPTLYVGGIVSADVSFHSGNIKSLERTFTCAEYGSGSGFAGGAGLSAEWWIQPKTAIQFSTMLRSSTVEFATPTMQLPLATGEFLSERYSLSTNALYLSVVAAAKQRFLLPFAFVSAGVQLDSRVSSSISQKVEALEPTWFRYNDTKSTSKQLSNSEITELRQLTASLLLSVGYDLDVGEGQYMLPALFVTLPMVSASPLTDWYSTTFGLRCSWLLGL